MTKLPKVNPFFYGFMTGFFLTFVFLASQNSPKTLPVINALLISLQGGALVGIIYWCYVKFLKSNESKVNKM